MAVYSFKGIDKTGKEIKSSVSSESLIAAKQKVKTLGIMLIDIKEEKSEKSKKSSLLSFGSGVSISELSMMTRQLATLTKAKIQIVEALAALSEQVESDNLRVILGEVKQKVNEGASLARALSEHPKVFTNVYVNMVEAGEASGTLEVVLLRLADFTESQMKLKNKISSAMTYPVIMGIFGFAMLNIIFIFVIPKIAKIFVAQKKELPIMTEISIGISHFMQNYWWLLMLSMVAVFVGLRKYAGTVSGKRRIDGIVVKLPILGILTKMINVSRFCSTLSTLLRSGVPILTALNIVKNIVTNVWMRDAIEESRAKVSEGASMTGPLIQSGFFPVLVTHMIKLGEQSGEIEEMLRIVAENYEDQVDTKISGLTSILEPIMMVVLGGVVGFVVVSVIVPLMNLNTLR
jgi:general secretion pathway protein F